ncbi:DNA repair protein rad50 [Schizosaccharomyces pombe]
MSCIDRMSIMGIRSFDNRSRESIQFFSPLTLIVGQNGSGKTTIIECLKYATTGILPPNTKGGAFIHDPKICGEKEVLAQVKLAFRNTNQVKMICTRSLQLSVKKTTRQQKTLDGQLLILKDNERTTISNRCAELDSQVPLSLGVSKALLDYVIFCHQEESFWPLSEPANLKKRFDEIFESLRYAKALDQIKGLKRDQETQVKVDQATLTHYRSDKERAEKIELRVHESLKRISCIRSKVEELDQEITETARLQDELFKSTEEYEQQMITIRHLESQSDIINTTINDLKSQMTITDESSEDLEKLHSNFAEKVKEEQELYKSLEKKRSDLESLLKSRRELLEKLTGDLGKIQGEIESLEKLKVKKSTMINEIVHRYNINEINEEGIMTEVSKYASLVNKNYEISSGKLKERQVAVRARIEGIKAHEMFLNNRVSEINSSLEKQLTTQKELRSRFEILFPVKLQREDFTKDVEKSDLWIKSLRQEYESKNLLELLDKHQTALSSVENRLDEISEIVDSYHKYSGVRTKLQVFEENKTNKSAILANQLMTLKSSFSEVMSYELKDDDNYNEELDKLVEDVRKKLQEKEEAESSLRSVRERLEIRISLSVQSINDLTENKKIKTKTLKSYSGTFASMISEIKALESEIEENRKTLHSLQFGSTFYEKAIEICVDQHACQLCQRSLDKEEEKLFVEHCHSMIDVIPSKSAEVYSHLETLTKTFKNLSEAKPIFDEIELLDKRLSETKTELSDLQGDLQGLDIRKDEIQSELDTLYLRRANLEKLQLLVKDISNLEEEIRTIDRETEVLRIELPSSIAHHNLDEIYAEREKLLEKRGYLRKQIERTKLEETSFKKKIDDAVLANNEQKLKLTKLNFQVNELEQLEKDINKSSEDCDLQKKKLLEVSSKQGSQAPFLNELESEYEKLEADIQEMAQKSRTEILEANEYLHQLNEWNSELRIDVSTKFKCIKEKKSNIGEEVRIIASKIESTDDNLRKLQERLADLRTRERNASDNLRLRALMRQLEEAVTQKNYLLSQQSHDDRESFRERMQILKSKYGALNAERAGLLGECKQLENSITKDKEELNMEFKDADERFRRQLIKTKTTGKANEDLGKYAKALDVAIMQLHSMKMNEINRIVDELWKQTYCGTDIDTILIRSDSEGKGNRTYNYRVCMVKGDAELDMRGRCSAGQKVLACIIIRLALAECLGVNCGILALDEPTTNLDEENICSLAKNLSRIVEFRRKQANFQLIVITHDEQFIRVKRDTNQKSMIVKEPL